MRPYPRADSKPIVAPLFHVMEGGLGAAGSGVLLTYGNRHFLCTAGHVVGRSAEHRVFIGGCDDPFPLDQSFLRNSIESMYNPENDPIDFAAAELSRNQADILTTRCRFYGLDIAGTYEPRLKRATHQVCGYLQEDNSSSEGIFTANCLQIEIVPDDGIVRRDPRRRQNVRWYIGGLYDPGAPGWRINKQFRGMADFSGMSGGAWFYGDPFCPGVFKEFAGIALEARSKKRAVTEFIGIRARAIVDLLFHWFPGLPRPAVKS